MDFSPGSLIYKTTNLDLILCGKKQALLSNLKTCATIKLAKMLIGYILEGGSQPLNHPLQA